MRTLFTLIALATLAASPPLIESSGAQEAPAAHDPADGPAPPAEEAASSAAIKLRFEPQYSIIKPDDYGTRWSFRFQIAPVIQNPF